MGNIHFTDKEYKRLLKKQTAKVYCGKHKTEKKLRFIPQYYCLNCDKDHPGNTQNMKKFARNIA